MGQKVHPLGFRVGITKSHQSKWFARFHKHKYAQTLLEDRLLRENLLKLFPDLLNPVLKKVQKREGTVQISPQITHIKIERGLIPYEIGIQIHAGNCKLVKSAIDQLKVNDNLVHNFQKTNHYLLDFKKKWNESSSTSQTIQTSLKKSVKSNYAKLSSHNKVSNRFKALPKGRTGASARKPRLTFRQSLLANMMILKKGQKITRKFQKNFSFVVAKQSKMKFSSEKFDRRRSPFNSKQRLNANSNRTYNNRFAKTKRSNFNKQKQSQRETNNFGQSPNTRAFVDIFLSKMSAKFITTLKKEMNEWNNFMKAHKQNQLEKYGTLRFAPLGYQRKWSLSRLARLKKQPLNLLKNLLKFLQKKALKKMDLMQKEFTVLGAISKIESLNYYQMIRFIKSLKQMVQQMKFEQESMNGDQKKLNRFRLDSNVQTQQKFEKILLKLTETAIRKKLRTISNECRKIQFLDYLQIMVKKHRQKNIFLYLSTISDSRKYLRKIQNFTKKQAPFLFKVDFNSISQYPVEKQREILTKKVSKAYKQASQKNPLEANVQDVFLKQFLKQKNVCQDNIALTPKISIKFYSVKEKNLLTNASLVADTIVDDLEKRKAFRRVIKQAKDKLMANKKVKGVKIQVSGRLNGAEIARSEWVRAGRVPLQTLRANIDYCYKTANTIYGIIGVKVWIYKGYTQLCKSKKPVSMSQNLFQ